MGYGVYFRDGRWAGYGVPAVCEHPNCEADIDRGMDYRCGSWQQWRDENPQQVAAMSEAI